MPHFPGHRRSRLQGLLDRGQGSGLFGPNLPPGGVPLGGRINLIGGGGPNPAALAGSRSFTNRIGAPSVAPPTSPRTFRTEGRKVSDIFKDAQIGRYGSRPAVGGIGGGGGGMSRQALAIQNIGQQLPGTPGYGQFGPPVQQVQQVQQAQGTGPTAGQGLTSLGTAAVQRFGGPSEQSWGDVWAGGQGAGGPGGILDTSQGFFDRMIGEKGSPRFRPLLIVLEPYLYQLGVPKRFLYLRGMVSRRDRS